MLVSKSVVLSLSALEGIQSTGNPYLAQQSQKPRVEELPTYEIVKAAFDFIVASALILVLFPLMLLVAALVKLTSPGPAIYSQVRLTKGGKKFTMFKFRTMCNDAERGTGAVWAKKGDPRVTKLGAFLRKTRLDELPQLVNVVRGEMSLIGPRPERPEIATELVKVLPRFSKRLEVKAGITGLAQTYSGYASNYDDYRRKLALDIKYVRDRSVAMDAAIIARTVRVVVSGDGAW